MNWIEAYNRLFDIINANGNSDAPEYISGYKLMKILSKVDYSIPKDYNTYIQERRINGQSTTRRIYYEDILNSLPPKKRVVAYNTILGHIAHINPIGLDELRKLIGTNPYQDIKKVEVPESVLSNDLYFDIIKTINQYLQNVENKPSMFLRKGEEDIRDLVVSMLETRYERTTTTGETINRKGKTDILIKKDTGENLFIAECKIWHGLVEFYRAINQLFDNYMTWRDTKVAILLFVKTKGISSILEKLKQGVRNHPYFVREISTENRSSFSYHFRNKLDPEIPVNLEIMLFHFPDNDV